MAAASMIEQFPAQATTSTACGTSASELVMEVDPKPTCAAGHNAAKTLREGSATSVTRGRETPDSCIKIISNFMQTGF